MSGAGSEHLSVLTVGDLDIARVAALVSEHPACGAGCGVTREEDLTSLTWSVPWRPEGGLVLLQLALMLSRALGERADTWLTLGVAGFSRLVVPVEPDPLWMLHFSDSRRHGWVSMLVTMRRAGSASVAAPQWPGGYLSWGRSEPTRSSDQQLALRLGSRSLPPSGESPFAAGDCLHVERRRSGPHVQRAVRVSWTRDHATLRRLERHDSQLAAAALSAG